MKPLLYTFAIRNMFFFIGRLQNPALLGNINAFIAISVQKLAAMATPLCPLFGSLTNV